MNLIIDLPSELQASIVEDWIEDTAELVHLDTAFCNKRLRPDFLKMLTSSYKVTSVSVDYSDGVMWMINRGVRANDIVVQTDDPGDEDVIEFIFSNLGPTATSITFEEYHEAGVYYPSTPCDWPEYLCPNIIQHCPNLTSIIYEERGVNSQIAQIITASKQLKKVSFRLGTYLTSDVLIACCASTSLESLDITRCTMAHDTTDVVLTARNTTLRTLLATECKLSAVSTAALLATFTHLTHLSLSLVGTVDVLFVAERCPQLQKCNLDNVTSMINGETATVLCVHWKHLEYLGLRRPFNYDTVTDEALIVFIRQCHTLKRLRLVHCTENQLTNIDDPILPSNTVGSGSQLVDLHVHSITADTLHTVCTLCPRLDSLRLHYCPTVMVNNTTQAVHKPIMAEQALHLLHSNIRVLILDNTVLTSQDLLNIRNLQSITLTKVKGNFTIDTLVTMVKKCPNLTTFVMTRPPLHINASVVRRILDVAPKLHTFAFIPLDSLYGQSSRFVETGAHHALTDMILHFYPNITGLCLPL